MRKVKEIIECFTVLLRSLSFYMCRLELGKGYLTLLLLSFREPLYEVFIMYCHRLLILLVKLDSWVDFDIDIDLDVVNFGKQLLPLLLLVRYVEHVLEQLSLLSGRLTDDVRFFLLTIYPVPIFISYEIICFQRLHRLCLLLRI